MSFEGYQQMLCKNGHQIIDNADADASKVKCYFCKAPIVWWNIVDDTNCDQYGLVKLKVKTKEIKCTCKECGNIHIKVPVTYYIPKSKGHLVK